MGSDLAGDGKGEVISGAHAKRELAREIAAHLFSDVIRVHGRGRYHRTPESVWLLDQFSISDFEGSRYLSTPRRFRFEVDIGANGPWTYRLEFNQDNLKRPIIRREVVTKGGELVLERPDDDDRDDEKRLTQTHLEQLNANRPFRELQEFLAKVRYLHIVPQLVREPCATFPR